MKQKIVIKNRIKNRFLMDFLMVTFLAILSFRISLISSIVVFLYCTYRIFTSNSDECIYLILLFCANTNVFFVAGAPIGNLIIFISVLRLFLRRYIKREQMLYLCLMLSFYEIFHLFLYDFQTVIQSIIWCSAVAFIVIYTVMEINDFDLQKAKLYFAGGVICSTIYGMFYRIYSGRGFTVASFNINDSARFGGGFYDPNYFALSCILIFAFVLERVCTDEREKTGFDAIPFWKLTLISLGLLYFCVCGLSKSFVILLLILLGLCVPKLLELSKGGLKFALFVALIMILVFLIVKYTSYDFLSLFSKTISRFMEAQNINELTTNRFDIITNGLNLILSNPVYFLLGIGVQAYAKRLYGSYLHSFPVEIFVTLGMVGLVLFVILFMSLYKYAKRIYRNIDCPCSYMHKVPLIVFCIGICSLNAIEVELFYPLALMLIINCVYNKDWRK